ncbi:restriction endonuclease subunit S [Gilliamella sp. B2894]|uniref:restriction endonuclease subunit S n=1 Tax=unclassified Gilliamella TaxID=2685620 RepID=UPI00226A87DE|nr:MULTISPECIES: restriction endonuclease subunit S [unclassified Gilliamella]MCX8656365.1 restriction endonuclease subunit S [Gilliamella sp. B2894]MCX8693659.1 restriction endonuclease subunit S [Gilliamella sp. B2881]MCX8696390.1 restriction endonuclease subunit S [Gilliamella sp. B2828]
MASIKSKVPKLRFKGFSGEWNITKLCDISDKVQEKNKNNLINETFTNSAEYGIINQRDFFNKDISNEINLCHYYVVQPNDFVYNPRISNLAPVGPIKRNKLNRTGVMSPLYYVFRTHSINNDFLDYYFSTSKWHRFMFMNGDKGARSDRFAIGDSVFRTMPILTPKQQEQTQIGHFFQKLDQVIELQQHALTQAQNYKKAMLQKMFPQKDEKVPKVRFNGFSGDWNKKKLEDLLKQIKSYSLSRDVEVENNTGLKYIHYGDIHRKKANIIGHDEMLPNIKYGDYLILQKGDLVLADASEDYQGIAQPCILNFSPMKNKIVAGLHTIAIRPIKQSSMYLYYFFHTDNFKKHCYLVGTGMKVFGITYSNLVKFEGYFPSFEEQTQIGNFFQQLDKQITEQQNKLTHYQTLKKAMLQRLFI